MNRRLAAELVARFSAAGAQAQLVDLADYPMPLYHGDDEASNGRPDAAQELHDLLDAVDGLVLVSPEYNGGMPALLKNSIDWVTRVDRDVFRRMMLGFAATTPGGRGGQQVLSQMRGMFETHMRLDVHDTDLSVPSYGEAFGEAPAGLVRADAVEAADEFVRTFTAALSARAERAVAQGV